MNAETPIQQDHSDPEVSNIHLLARCFDGLERLKTKTEGLLEVLGSLEETGDANAQRSAARLTQQLSTLEGNVTMIGQVKAGKTSLVNAMAGRPGLLPADVNPWTSVVTSIHLNPTPYPQGNHSSFRFFDDEEWTRLMVRGGRVGELASRTGAADELEKIRIQITEMREKTRARLGKKFELLLGQRHNYGYFDGELIERYVCLGDDFEDDIDLKSNQGRFADITKSADLYLHRGELPLPLCIRDTPGVNDTFMMREQITIRAIRDSRTCVVVLSAHQALSSVDMALIRLISNVQSRDVVIFVNRIDELPEPSSQVPEIRASIERTLKNHHGPEDVEIIFGSAYWANSALTGDLNGLADASASSLINWAESQLEEDPGTLEAMVWELSGVPALYRAISRRIEEGPGQELLNRTATRAINLANAAQAQSRLSTISAGRNAACQLSDPELLEHISQIEAACRSALSDRFANVHQDFHKRLDRAHRSFLDRATAALVAHLERFGDEAVWSYDPTGLRVLLRSSYQVFGRNAQSATQEVLTLAANEFSRLYSLTFSGLEEDQTIETPPPPRIAPPILLGQTIALDLKGNWWTRWWQRRRGFRAYAMEFADMIRAETDPIITGLKESHCAAAQEDARSLLAEFLDDQKSTLVHLAEQVRSGAAAQQSTEADIRQTALDDTIATLNKYAA